MKTVDSNIIHDDDDSDQFSVQSTAAWRPGSVIEPSTRTSRAGAPSSSSISAPSIPVPLPTEIPPPPDLSSLPAPILHSGTVETLIGLNEDLMARLKVNIRRNSILEQQIMELEKLHDELARVNGSLTSQLQILQEKDRVWREKTQREDSRHDSLKAEIELLNTRLQAAEERREQLHADLKSGSGSAFRRRVHRWVKPMVRELKSTLTDERRKSQALEEQSAIKDAQLSDLRARLADAVAHIQSQEKDFTKDQAKLVEQYESRLSRLEADFQKACTELKVSREKAIRMDEAVAIATTAQNRIVYLERRNHELEKNLRTDAIDLQSQVARYQQEAKVLAVETLELDRKLNEATQKLQAQTESYQRLQDQFESLQTVWSEAQKRLEIARLQHESLNQLNQELSRQLMDLRKAREATAAHTTAAATTAAAVVATTTTASTPAASTDLVRLRDADL